MIEPPTGRSEHRLQLELEARVLHLLRGEGTGLQKATESGVGGPGRTKAAAA